MAGNQDNQGYPKLDVRAARALNPHTQTIRIESILGGHSQLSHFAAKDQFEDSYGIDPSLKLTDDIITATGSTSLLPTGLLRPSNLTVTNPTTSIVATGNFLWLESEPINGAVYATFSSGSAYVVVLSSTGSISRTFTALSDTGALSSSSGNGMAYYDGYMYFAKNTDIARYNLSTGAWEDSYWQGTLGLAALTNTTYPTNGVNSLPNHVMHRHSDGKLYITDVSGGNGVIHVISTLAGTNNGSAFAKLTFGTGLYPTAIESYGSQLAISLYEGPAPSVGSARVSKRAKLAFWDTTSLSFNQITWVEFPDEILTAMKNVDGILYFTSGTSIGTANTGMRVSQYIGGYSVKDVALRPDALAPLAGGIDGDSSRVVIASANYGPLNSGLPRACLYSFGVGLNGTGSKLFNFGGALDIDTTSYGAAVLLTSPAFGADSHKAFYFSYYSGTNNNAIITNTSIRGTGQADYSISTRKWRSQKFSIGQPFKITKIRFPLAQTMASNMIVTPVIYTDDTAGTTYTGGTSPGLAIMNNTNYSGKRNIVMRPQGLTGEHNFQLELQWTGSALCVMNLPITIEYELIPD